MANWIAMLKILAALTITTGFIWLTSMFGYSAEQPLTAAQSWSMVLYGICFWTTLIYWMIRRSRRGKWYPGDWLFILAAYGVRQFALALRWGNFLFRERKRAKNAQRVREFIALADWCLMRAKERNQRVPLIGSRR